MDTCQEIVSVKTVKLSVSRDTNKGHLERKFCTVLRLWRKREVIYRAIGPGPKIAHIKTKSKKNAWLMGLMLESIQQLLVTSPTTILASISWPEDGNEKWTKVSQTCDFFLSFFFWHEYLRFLYDYHHRYNPCFVHCLSVYLYVCLSCIYMFVCFSVCYLFFSFCPSFSLFVCL